jgi:eukaryotic-like serine/threonine-protein kinase
MLYPQRVFDPSALEVGELVAGKYTVEGIIGSGGMGRVYAAVNELIDQRVAIKVLRSEVSQIDGVTERFIREARASVALSSDHVGRVFDVGMLRADIPFIVMERLTGENLSKLIRDEGPLELGRVATILVQVCDAIAEAHGLGIVHRDIKPANIFVSVRRQGRIHAKILDFGIAKALTETHDMQLTTTGTALGTPQYMSPEQMADSALAGPPSDVWALGVTLYHALTKRYPFESTSPLGLAMKVAREAHIPLENFAPHLPAKMFRIVDACLKKNPDERITVTELQEALGEFEILAPRPSHEGNRTLDAHRAPSASAPDLGSSPKLPPRSKLVKLYETAPSGVQIFTEKLQVEPSDGHTLHMEGNGAPETQLSGASPSFPVQQRTVSTRFQGTTLRVGIFAALVVALSFGLALAFLIKRNANASVNDSPTDRMPTTSAVPASPPQEPQPIAPIVDQPQGVTAAAVPAAPSTNIAVTPASGRTAIPAGRTRPGVALPVKPTVTATSSARSSKVIANER